MKKPAILLSKTLKRRDNTMKNRRKAFTLVELLVVVVIVALSISVLIPVLTAAGEQASNIEICAGNQREILRAINDYADANDGWYPVGWYWPHPDRPPDKKSVEALLLEGGFLDSAAYFQCPSDDADFGPLGTVIVDELGQVQTERNQDNYRTYGLNLNYYGWASRAQGLGGWRKQGEVRMPQRTVLISETPSLYNILFTYGNSYFGPASPNMDTTFGRISGYTHWPGWDIWAASKRHGFIHETGCNFGFADGHVEYVEVDIEEEYPPFWWFDNGFYRYNRFPSPPRWP